MKREIGKAVLYRGDSREVLCELEENSIHAICTDPPYALVSIQKRFGKAGSAPAQYGTNGLYQRASKGFMNTDWDNGSCAFDPEFWSLVLKCLCPGGHLLAFGGTRSAHRLACAIEDAGFEIRDSILAAGGIQAGPTLHYMYGTGFPKSTSVAEGIGSSLKPSHEIIYMARKPLDGTLKQNYAKWGTGGLNIDAARIPTGQQDARQMERVNSPKSGKFTRGKFGMAGQDGFKAEETPFDTTKGRYPANSVYIHHPLCEPNGDCHEDCAVAELDRQSGMSTSSSRVRMNHADAGTVKFTSALDGIRQSFGYEEGPAGSSRFFAQFRYEPSDFVPFRYEAKASRSDREKGLEEMAQDFTDDGRQTPIDNPFLRGGTPRRNVHPTVKSTSLIKYLIELICPPGGVVLDCFMGSGSTIVAAERGGFASIGIEREENYYEISCNRVQDAANLCGLFRPDAAEVSAPTDVPPSAAVGTVSLFDGDEDA